MADWLCVRLQSGVGGFNSLSWLVCGYMATKPFRTVESTSAGAVICVKRDSSYDVLLMVQNNDFYQKKYGRVPKGEVVDIGAKGRLEEGESLADAARREVRQETGFDIKLDDKFQIEDAYEFDEFSKQYNETLHIKKRVVYFAAVMSPEEAGRIKLSEEHISSRFVEIGKAISEEKYPNRKKILEAVERRLLELSKT